MSACVLSGGTMKGAFQIGVLRQLSNAGVSFTHYYGTSVGSINSTAVASAGLDKTEAMWRTIHKRSDIFGLPWWRWLWSTGFMSLAPLAKKLKATLTEERRAIAQVCYVDLVSGEIKYVTSTEVSLPDLVQAVLCSSSQPMIMESQAPQVGAPPTGTDGGVREVTPLTKAIRDGHDDITVILCSPLKPNPEPWSMPTSKWLRWLKVGFRAVSDLSIHEIFWNDIKEVVMWNAIQEKLGDLGGVRNIKLTVYAPSSSMESFEFSQEKLEGYRLEGLRSNPLNLQEIFPRIFERLEL